jgi:hypothetical protein
MTVSRFELGKMIPRDARTLKKLFDTAVLHPGLKAQAKLFADARREALRQRPHRDRNTPFANQMIPFTSLEEWRIMNTARIAARYYPIDEYMAMLNAAPQSMEIVDAVLQKADASKGIDEAFYDELVERLLELAERRALERRQKANK